MNGIEIILPGPLTTVQDMGRHGYLGEGFCPSGVMDVTAARIASALAGNREGDGGGIPAVLEMTMQGVTCAFLAETVFALAGADMPMKLNDDEISPYTAHRARAGDTLEIGYAPSGCRGYLAFLGGVDVPLVLGSRSTHVKCGIGGFEGRRLKRGDIVPLFTDARRENPRTAVAVGRPAARPSPAVIRVADGPQADMFSRESLRKFTAAEYAVSAQSDRMGVRLDGEPLKPEGGADIVSDGIPMGAVQVSNAGQPMILLADRQTVGGYAKPFVVIEADLPLLAQARPGDMLRFARVSARQARIAALDAMAEIGRTLRRIDEMYTGKMRFAGFTISR